ncbi:response regulator transcription factor [Flavobacterium sp. SUN052]|uniref:LytR/AlgR family response regulator transcription factor n=1 Tax=Flavobacterium sp. SUN052 TaxID=3002441 RepID=UPI002DB86084|nr:response regulator transcription factor [Flavobacterium sp. SUN052]MEC4004213.1 response regulator transcription factor [Flavobacterium sp. SUN052]
MKKFTFVIIDDNQITALKTKAIAESFQSMRYLAKADNYDDGLDIVLEYQPDVVFLEIDPQEKESKLSLALINELHRYLTVVPKIIVTTTNDAFCLEAFKYGVFDYFITPIEVKELRKTLFRLEKETENTIVTKNIAAQTNNFASVKETNTLPINEVILASPENNTVIQDVISLEDQLPAEVIVIDNNEEKDAEIGIVTAVETNVEAATTTEPAILTIPATDSSKTKPLVICVKSYGDYRYIDASDICYLQADNNSTDIHLNSGEMITAFKTLKHFEGVLTYPFARIHNSYIVNVDYVSRIHTGNAVCHIKNTTTKLPFSKSYKENIDVIIATIASGNYLEI